MKRRLSLAMALLGQPDLIILDEPTVESTLSYVIRFGHN